MDFKKCLKINYKLGSNFLLVPTSDGWILMRSGSYRPIMNSNENTEEELEQFVREHREYNTLVIMRKFSLIANVIILSLCLSNIYIHSELLSYFVMGALVILIPTLMIVSFIGESNREVYEKVLDEDMAFYGKELCKEQAKEESKKTKKVEKKSSTRAKRGRKKSSEVQK